MTLLRCTISAWAAAYLHQDACLASVESEVFTRPFVHTLRVVRIAGRLRKAPVQSLTS